MRCQLGAETAELRFTAVRFQPFQIESASGFDAPLFCSNDLKVIFPAFVASLAILMASVLGFYLYRTNRRARLRQEATYREM